jgi:hypothetical protein
MKLIDIPVVYICPDHNQKYNERKQHMDRLLNSIGFKSIIHFKSGTEEYPTCLAKATIVVLNQFLNDEPVIILEDDIEAFLELNDKTDIIIPEDTDAFYLGFSMCGGSKTDNVDDGPCIIEKYSDTYIRILNMLSAHAILYKSKIYKKDIIKSLSSIIGKDGYYNDVVIARLQSSYNIYGYYYPFFYQSHKFGNVQHVENCTKFRISFT